MNLKKAIPLGAALLLGLIAARLVVRLIENKQAKPDASAARLVNVVMSARDLAPGDPIAEADLKTGQVAADAVPANSFTDVSQVVGRVVTSAVGSGQEIVDSALAPKGSGAGLQAVIPPGMRAITVEINEITGVAGYIAPGCRVDLVETLRDDSSVSTQTLTGCLAQNVQVTAVGTRPLPGQDPQVGRSATLLVTPRQAELIELATAVGHPRLVLRGAKDQTINDLPTVTLTELISFRRPKHTEVSLPTTKPVGDPFAAKTPGAPPAPQWSMRVVSGGEPGVVNVLSPLPARPSADTGNDSRDMNGP